jgi:hypothetical protein
MTRGALGWSDALLRKGQAQMGRGNRNRLEPVS